MRLIFTKNRSLFLMAAVLLMMVFNFSFASPAYAATVASIKSSNDPNSQNGTVLTFSGAVPGTGMTVSLYINGALQNSATVYPNGLIGGWTPNINAAGNGANIRVDPGGASCTVTKVGNYHYCGVSMPDNDGDGIPNITDSCPNQGDQGFGLLANGCPIPDSDGDGVGDNNDACPSQGSVGFGIYGDGCPIPDTDGDGVGDNTDACPSKHGQGSADGCPPNVAPDPDSDGDGIPDSRDNCPNRHGGGSSDGCPIQQVPDSDGDGWNDQVDGCPNEYGTQNGCPPCPDDDGDGVCNDVNECPNRVDEGNGLEPNGCPVNMDSDFDGLLDDIDACPYVFGIDEWYGCPDLPKDGECILATDGSASVIIRSESSTDSSSTGMALGSASIPHSYRFDIIGSTAGWYQIQINPEFTGWVSTDYIRTGGDCSGIPGSETVSLAPLVPEECAGGEVNLAGMERYQQVLAVTSSDPCGIINTRGVGNGVFTPASVDSHDALRQAVPNVTTVTDTCFIDNTGAPTLGMSVEALENQLILLLGNSGALQQMDHLFAGQDTCENAKKILNGEIPSGISGGHKTDIAIAICGNPNMTSAHFATIRNWMGQFGFTKDDMEGTDGCRIVGLSTQLINPTQAQLDIYNAITPQCMPKIDALGRLIQIIGWGADNVVIPSGANCSEINTLLIGEIGNGLEPLPVPGWGSLICQDTIQLFVSNHAENLTQQQLNAIYSAPHAKVCGILEYVIGTGDLPTIPRPRPEPTPEPGPGTGGDSNNLTGDTQAWGEWIAEIASTSEVEEIVIIPPGGGTEIPEDVMNAVSTAAFVGQPEGSTNTDIYVVIDREAVLVEGLPRGEKRSPILVYISSDLQLLSYILIDDEGTVSLKMYNLNEQREIYFQPHAELAVNPDSRIAWTPAGMLIALVDEEGQSAIYRLNPAEPRSYEQPLIVNAANPAISNDGNIIFQRPDDNNENIHLWFPVGSGETSESLNPTDIQKCYSPVFGTDPTSFYFACRNEAGLTTLYGQALSDANLQTIQIDLTDIQHVTSGPLDEQLTIDNQQIIYQIAETGGTAEPIIRLGDRRVSSMFWLQEP